MAAHAEIVLLGRRWMPVSPERRAMVLDVRIEIHDPGPVHMMNQEVRYPPAAFQGMTVQQAQTAILTTGVGGIPSLNSIALGFLADWNLAAAVRGLTFPITFVP